MELDIDKLRLRISPSEDLPGEWEWDLDEGDHYENSLIRTPLFLSLEAATADFIAVSKRMSELAEELRSTTTKAQEES